MAALRRDWAALAPALAMLEPLDFTAEGWSLVARMRAGFGDRAVHLRLPLAIARIRAEAGRDILDAAGRLGEVATATFDDAGGDPMARHARAFGHDVDALMRLLVPPARYRKGHYAYGLFTAPEPHGLHTDHSAEDPAAGGEPICLARIGTLGTHYVPGDDRAHDARTRRMLDALRYWTPVPEGEPEDVLEELLRQGILRTIPVDHVVLMVAGNGSERAQPTQHIAARPPEGGLHSALFQRQYRLA